MAKSLIADPRYQSFVERYAFDLTRFAIEVCMQTPTWQQILMYESVQDPGSRTSVSSGHGTGKTNGFSVVCLWHLLCYRFSNTYLTGPKLNTVAEGVWKEFAARKDDIAKSQQAWIGHYLMLETKTVYIAGHKLNWFCTARTAPRGAPEGLAGTHGEWLLWVADEASGIPDANFGVIGGALTDARNRLVMASQPTRSSGFFYDTHHKLSTRAGGPFCALTFNSEESPLVSDAFLEEKVKQYGGVGAAEYQIKVKGQFPENSDKFLIGARPIERLIGAAPVIDDAQDTWGHMLVIDVAAGVYRDKTVVQHMKVFGSGDRLDQDPRKIDVVSIPVYSNSLDWTDIVGRVVDYVVDNRLSNPTVVVDIGGQGEQFARLLERAGITSIYRARWGDPCFRDRNRLRFFNGRAQCSVHAAEAVKDGRITFARQYREDLVLQGSRIPFHFDERARYHIMPKEQMLEKEGLPSPDLWDTICMAFLERAVYTPAERTGGSRSDERAQELDAMAAMMASALPPEDGAAAGDGA